MAGNPCNIIPDQEIVLEGGAQLVPAPEAADAGKVLGVTNQEGGIGWVEGQSGTVDQTYNASSTNAQSGTAVAEALGTETTLVAGSGITLTESSGSLTVAVDYDTNTLDVVGQTITENVAQQSSSGLFLLPSSVAALLSQQDNTQVTVHIPANMLMDRNLDYDDEPETIAIRFALYATNSTSESSVALFSTPLAREDEGSGPTGLISEQDVVFNLPASVANHWSQALLSAAAFSFVGQRDGWSPATSGTIIVVGNLATNPITFTFVDSSATKLAVSNPLPASTSADAGKVLQVQNDGTLAWVTLS